MASASAVLLTLTATILLVLPRIATITSAANEELKNENLDTTTQIKIERKEFEENSTLVNETKQEFVPSFHLGPIGTFMDSSNNLPKQASVSPFNGQQYASLVSDRSNSFFNSVRPIKFENDYDYNKSEKLTQKQVPSSLGNKNENTIKFVHENLYEKDESIRERNINKFNQRYSQTPLVFEPTEYPDKQQLPQEIIYRDENNYITGPHYAMYEIKPSKFHDTSIYSLPYQQLSPITDDNSYVQYQPGQLETFQPDEKFTKPETIINVHPMSYQTTSFDMHSKPKTVVYVTSHESTMTKKIPYQYYQPIIFDHTLDPPAMTEIDDKHQYPLLFEQQDKSVIPWKKIFHIIGAFLPLGLLLAFLSPKVVNAGSQNSDPNIVLSKLRISDLPAEHKESRHAVNNGQDDECIMRLICRLLTAADSTSSNFLRQLLLQIISRTPESAVRKKELERIFEAAKLRNCDILTCNFYDGT